jgi:hypothetical protein
MLAGGLAWSSLAGCALEEVRNRLSAGPEFQHRGSSRTDSTRYSVQDGLELKWENGVTTAATYRRRDTDDGDGNNDNALWLELGVPLWKAKKKPDASARRIDELEKRIAHLEQVLEQKTSHAR